MKAFSGLRLVKYVTIFHTAIMEWKNYGKDNQVYNVRFLQLLSWWKVERVSYLHTICSMSFLLFIHVAALLCWINKESILFGGDKDVFVLKFTVLETLAAIGFWRLAPEKYLQSMTSNGNKIKRGGWLLVFYWILIMALLILGMIY